jgi:hypothetical protein
MRVWGISTNACGIGMRRRFVAAREAPSQSARG